MLVHWLDRHTAAVTAAAWENLSTCIPTARLLHHRYGLHHPPPSISRPVCRRAQHQPRDSDAHWSHTSAREAPRRRRIHSSLQPVSQSTFVTLCWRRFILSCRLAVISRKNRLAPTELVRTRQDSSGLVRTGENSRLSATARSVISESACSPSAPTKHRQQSYRMYT